MAHDLQLVQLHRTVPVHLPALLCDTRRPRQGEEPVPARRELSALHAVEARLCAGFAGSNRGDLARRPASRKDKASEADARCRSGAGASAPVPLQVSRLRGRGHRPGPCHGRTSIPPDGTELGHSRRHLVLHAAGAGLPAECVLRTAGGRARLPDLCPLRLVLPLHPRRSHQQGLAHHPAAEEPSPLPRLRKGRRGTEDAAVGHVHEGGRGRPRRTLCRHRPFKLRELHGNDMSWWEGSSASSLPRTSAAPILPSASPTSGTAGTSRSPPGSGTASTSRSEAADARSSAAIGTSS